MRAAAELHSNAHAAGTRSKTKLLMHATASELGGISRFWWLQASEPSEHVDESGLPDALYKEMIYQLVEGVLIALLENPTQYSERGEHWGLMVHVLRAACYQSKVSEESELPQVLSSAHRSSGRV